MAHCQRFGPRLPRSKRHLLPPVREIQGHVRIAEASGVNASLEREGATTALGQAT